MINRLGKILKSNPKRTVTVSIEDIYSLILTLQGKNYEDHHLDRVKNVFPELLE